MKREQRSKNGKLKKSYSFLRSLFSALFDFIFPLSEEENLIKSLSHKDLYLKLSKSNHPNSLFCYKDKLVKEIIWQMKFRGRRKYAKSCAEFLYKKFLGNFEDKFLLIPIPIHPKRRKERGFNQTEWICEEIKKLDLKNKFLYDPKIIIRKVYTEKQSWNSRKERFKNMQGVFEVIDSDKVKNKKVILIDDVTTTGATISEAEKVLEESGAKNIIALTIAH